jgi:hypothetical protein
VPEQGIPGELLDQDSGDHHGQSRALARHGRAAASISARAELNDL